MYEQPTGGTSPVPAPLSGTLQKLRPGGSATVSRAASTTATVMIRVQPVLSMCRMANPSLSPGCCQAFSHRTNRSH